LKIRNLYFNSEVESLVVRNQKRNDGDYGGDEV
jgi:hypothetical protein